MFIEQVLAWIMLFLYDRVSVNQFSLPSKGKATLPLQSVKGWRRISRPKRWTVGIRIWIEKLDFFLLDSWSRKSQRLFWIKTAPVIDYEKSHFSSGIVERAKRERAWKSPHARKGDTRRAFLAWGDFHTRSRFACSTNPEEKWVLLVVYSSRWSLNYVELFESRLIQRMYNTYIFPFKYFLKCILKIKKSGV